VADTTKLAELIKQLDDLTLSDERRHPKHKLPTELAKVRMEERFTVDDESVLEYIVEVLNNSGFYEEIARYNERDKSAAYYRCNEEKKIAQAERARGRLRISTRYDMGATRGVVYVVEVAKVVTNNHDMFYYPVQEFSNLESAQEFVAGYGE
jgi:hypothetical protein